MNQKVAAGICSQVGTVIKRPEAEGEGGSFMRVQVRVDITIPLSRGRMVSLGQGKEVWVSFKYERLPNICYWCGYLTHDDKDCETWLESEGSLKAEDQQFGSWLRAAPTSRTKKNLVTVPGLFKKTSRPPPQNPINPRKPLTRSMVVRSPTRGVADMEKIQTNNSMSHLRGTVTQDCPHVVEQQAESLRIEEIQLAYNAPLNEARNEFSSLGSPDSVHINEPNFSPSDSVHQDPYLPTLVEIDEGFSKLNARSTSINEGTRKQNLCHATNEELKAARVSNEEVEAARVSKEELEAARVYHVQGFVSQTTAQLHVNGKEEKKPMQQQGTWK